MPGIAVKTAVLNELQRQLNHELGASQSYLAMAFWCEDQNHKGFAAYFNKQAEEERVHARKFMDHLMARGVVPVLQALTAPQAKFKSLMEIAKHAQALEQSNTTAINKVYEAALAEKDFPAQVLLHWFINEQVEEEDWADEMVERVEAATCCGGVMDLDRHLERFLNAPKE